MMYFATFISGCSDIIATRLQRFPNAQLQVRDIQDGLVVFDSEMSVGQLSDLRFFNTVYSQLKHGEIPEWPRGSRVQIRAYRGTQSTSIPADLQQKVIDAGYQLVAHKPQYELLWWQHGDGQELWGQALPRPGYKTRRLEPGELRSELAHILGLVASLDSRDIVLDPFAGYGAIPRECLQGFHCQQVMAIEQNQHLIPHLKSIPHLIAMQGDARKMEHLETRCVDRVITDPPWGDYDKVGDHELKDLYHRALSEIHRVLRAKGCAVIVTAATWLGDMAADQSFVVEKQYDIVVAGKKVHIFKLRKS